MKYKRYTKEFKYKVVMEYLNGASGKKLCYKYEINKSQLYHWRDQWRKNNDFPDSRGRKSTGRPKNLRQDNMTDKEYIEKLEMEVDILKYIAFLKRKNQK